MNKIQTLLLLLAIFFILLVTVPYTITGSAMVGIIQQKATAYVYQHKDEQQYSYTTENRMNLFTSSLPINDYFTKDYYFIEAATPGTSIVQGGTEYQLPTSNSTHYSITEPKAWQPDWIKEKDLKKLLDQRKRKAEERLV